MLVQIKLLHDAAQLKEQLELAGWRLTDEQDDSFTAGHSLVTTEEEARHYLNNLGLLTSPLLRIRFAKAKRPAKRLLATR